MFDEEHAQFESEKQSAMISRLSRFKEHYQNQKPCL